MEPEFDYGPILSSRERVEYVQTNRPRVYSIEVPEADKERETEQAGQHGRVRGLRLPEEDRGRDTGLLLPEPVLHRDGEGDPGPADVRAVQHGATHVGGVS